MGTEARPPRISATKGPPLGSGDVKTWASRYGNAGASSTTMGR